MQKSVRDKVLEYVKQKYGTEPEYLWMRFPRYAVFRHPNNCKWYALIMDVLPEKLGLSGKERIDILNVNSGDPLLTELLIQQRGYSRGYHFSRGNWISVLLDGTVPFDQICHRIDESYTVTASKSKR
ncbi:MAG: MmcQ/YjbR family DNA-binding protein [Clostridia bacterium]|nr:MmcQ/YjbR family DNA-binding protein [Clostridia bacterium]